MPQGKGTYGSKRGRPPKKKKGMQLMSRGLYANIHAKRKRIKAGSGERMRSAGSRGAPTAAQFRRAKKTAKKKTQGQRPASLGRPTIR